MSLATSLPLQRPNRREYSPSDVPGANQHCPSSGTILLRTTSTESAAHNATPTFEKPWTCSDQKTITDTGAQALPLRSPLGDDASCTVVNRQRVRGLPVAAPIMARERAACGKVVMPDSPSVVRAHRGVLAAVWRGDPVQALGWAAHRRFWVWVFVANAVCGAAAWTTVLPTVSRTSSMVGRTVLGLDGSVSQPQVSWWQLLLVAVAGMVVTFVVQVLRVVAVRLTFAVREIPVQTVHALVPVATGAAVLTVVYLVAFVVCLVPTTSAWFFVVAAGVAAVPALTAEILVFVAVERTTTTRSLLVPHAALTVAWASAAVMLTALAVHLAPV